MKRTAGVLMHVSSLWGKYSGGSFGSPAYEWVDFLSKSGFSYWQVLPFCLPDEFNSPYKSFSAFSLNPFFIDLPMLSACGLVTSDELKEAEQHTPYLCEFDRLGKERLDLLAKAAVRLEKAGTALPSRNIPGNEAVPELPGYSMKALDDFFSGHPGSGDFCRYMALRAANGDKPHDEWTSDSPDAASLRTWKFTQYAFYVQWNALRKYAEKQGIGIIGDIPIYVAEESADVTFSPLQFLLGRDGHPERVAGVPPDYFAEKGQKWGNPLYNWDAMKADGFSWWRRRLSFMRELFDGIRIDHFRGFEAYYSIPADAPDATSGEWIDGPRDAILDVIRETCGDRLVIAEDLGVITPGVKALIERSGFPGMRVLQFGFDGDPESPHLPYNYPENCIAYSGTHDNNTLLGFVWELDEETRRRLTDYCGVAPDDWNSCYDALLRMLFASHASTVILPVQDLLLYGADTRLNTPGKEDGNWAYRVTKEQIASLDTGRLRRRNAVYGRLKHR